MTTCMKTKNIRIVTGMDRCTYTLPPVGSASASNDQESRKSCPMNVSPIDHVAPSVSRTKVERTSTEENVTCMAKPIRDT